MPLFVRSAAAALGRGRRSIPHRRPFSGNACQKVPLAAEKAFRKEVEALLATMTVNQEKITRCVTQIASNTERGARVPKGPWKLIALAGVSLVPILFIDKVFG